MQALRIPRQRRGQLALLASLLFAQSCGGDEVAGLPPAGEQLEQRAVMQGRRPTEVIDEVDAGSHSVGSDLPTIGPDSPITSRDRHALHGGAVDAKGVSIHEVRASLSVLMVMGEEDPHAFVEILSELATVGSDAAAVLALELHANPRLKFEGRDTAFTALFLGLLRFDAITDQRQALEAALGSLGSSDSASGDSEQS